MPDSQQKLLTDLKSELREFIRRQPCQLCYTTGYILGYEDAINAIPPSSTIDPIELIAQLHKIATQENEDNSLRDYKSGYMEALDDALYNICDEDEAKFNDIYAKNSIAVS